MEPKNVETPVMSQRRPAHVGSERGRRTSRNEVNYRIAPLSEFAGELERTGGKENDIIELSDADDDASVSQAQREENRGGDEEEEEEEEEEEGEGESEGEMVIN